MKIICFRTFLSLSLIACGLSTASCGQCEQNSKSDDNSFYFCKPHLMVKEMGSKFAFEFDSVDAIFPSGFTLKESFFIYDEKIGTFSDAPKDVPYYSMKFNCSFYQTNVNEIDFTNLKISNEIDKELSISYTDVFDIKVTLNNIDKTDYVISYLKTNLIKLSWSQL